LDKLLFSVLFAASFLVLLGGQQAFALNCESTITGFWDVSSTWINCGGGTPGNTDDVTIKTSHIVTIRTSITGPVLPPSSLTVESSAELIIDGTSGGRIVLAGATFANSGKITANGGSTPGQGDFQLNFSSVGTNECSGIINVNGNDDTTGRFLVIGNSEFVNKGTVNLFAGTGSDSGSLRIGTGSTVDNHGTINENPGPASDSGVVVNLGTFNDNLPSLCAVAGEIIPIETTSLILAGAQSPAVWIISTLSALGIGAFVFTRNPSNVRNIKVILRDYFDRF